MLYVLQSRAQEQKVEAFQEAIIQIDLDEVIVISSYKKALEHKSHHKPLSTLDEYLESSKKGEDDKARSYAWSQF